ATGPPLLMRTPDDGRMALPLSLVDRLEEIPAASIERAGESEVVQYRGDILPIVRLSQVLPERRVVLRNPDDDGTREVLEVVVVRHGELRAGIVVDQILDIVQQPIEMDPPGRPGAAGTVVVIDRVTEVIDLPAVLSLAGLT